MARIAVIGAGAAGFFAAIRAAELYPEAEVHILEKSAKLLTKVRISGGGRCNVTAGEERISRLAKAYPRGADWMRLALRRWSTADTKDWFTKRGVELKEEVDGRVFPVSDQSESIIEALLDQSRRRGISIRTRQGVRSIDPQSDGLRLHYGSGDSEVYDQVICAVGGYVRARAYEWLGHLGHEIIDPIPSLFTFNIPGHPITELMGISVPNVRVKLSGTQWTSTGPLLITHWGMSGPAIIKLSAYAARWLAARNYQQEFQINWVAERNENLIRDRLIIMQSDSRSKYVRNTPWESIPQRLWVYLLGRADVSEQARWSDLKSRSINRLIHTLTQDSYTMQGQTRFKEEFVTAGGVSLDSVHPDTLESLSVRGLYFAGEVLDIDGITGGYNFQAAWTTGYIAGSLGGLQI